MEEKVGRNDPCPCGSGKKYKQCHYGKEIKKTYTPSGKRKFTAKVISTSDKSQSIFQSTGGAPPMPTSAEPFELLRFKKTKDDFQVQKEEQPIFERPEEENPETVEQIPEMPPDDFEETQEDFRKD